MQRGGAEFAQGFEMFGGAVAFIFGEVVLGELLVEFAHTAVALGFGEDGGGGDGNGAGVAVNQRFLFDEDIEFDSIEQQVIRSHGEFRESGGHGLAAGLQDVPCVDAAGIAFGDGPCERVLANFLSELFAAIGSELFGIVEADDAAGGIEDNGGGENGTEERAAACFVETGDARPARLSRQPLEPRVAPSGHQSGESEEIGSRENSKR